MQCIPALAKNVNAIQLDEFADLPRLRLPSDVKVVTCSTEAEIRSACSTVLELLFDDQMTLQLGGDSEWEFSTEKAIGGSRKTALFTIALPTVVYLLRVCKVKTLPTSLRTLLMSRQIILVGRNISGDLTTLSKDFPEYYFDKNCGAKLVELGALAKAKNAVVDANASLASITAVTLQQNLSKDVCSSEWTAPTLTEDQIEYAALDAWVSFLIWDVLKTQKNVGEALKAASPVGQLVSLLSRKK
jgi:hypothetical protein